MRRQQSDPGFYRWPPHVNLLYPFVDSTSVVPGLEQAASKVEPFRIQLPRFGTFGGQRRGVLWLSPESAGDSLSTLHQHLEEAFPICRDAQPLFTPHMTLSHFETLQDALQEQHLMEQEYKKALLHLEFEVDRIYLLRREGDGGQFMRVAEIGLGSMGQTQIWDPPRAFPKMPAIEEEWVCQKRMELKKRRNGRGGSEISKLLPRPREERIPDPPHVIAAKRAERKAKREQSEEKTK